MTLKQWIAISAAGVFACGSALAAPPEHAKNKGKPGKEAKAHKGDKNFAKGNKDQAKAQKEHAKQIDKADKAHAKNVAKARKEDGKGNDSGARRFAPGFRDRELEVFRVYFNDYRDQPMNLPPGIAKRIRDGKGLPPGWQKKVEPGFVLEDPYWDAMVPVPYDLRRRLPEDDVARYYLLEDRLVRVHPDERRVLGLIRLAELLGN